MLKASKIFARLMEVRSAPHFKKRQGLVNFISLQYSQLRGLMNDEDEWDLALAEAATVQMPPKMRNLFATILVFGSVKDALRHWNKYKVRHSLANR